MLTSNVCSDPGVGAGSTTALAPNQVVFAAGLTAKEFVNSGSNPSVLVCATMFFGLHFMRSEVQPEGQVNVSR